MIQGRFGGRVAFVTGGASGIGRATCELLASEGARVAIADVNAEAAQALAASLRDRGEEAIAVACDVTSSTIVETTVGEVVNEYGSLDYAISCAGVIRDNLIHKLTEADWDTVIDVHLKGGFLVAQAAQRHMVPQRRGRIVFMSSGSSRGNRGQANYSAAKGGLEALARTLALELGRFGITVNAVAPGMVDTEMSRSTARRLGIDWDTFAEREGALVALGRIAQPQDIAGTIAFLCSDDAALITGQTIFVRGSP